MANFVLSVLSIWARQAKAGFIQKAQRADLVQERFLKRLLDAHQYTEFGLVHGLDTICSIEEFQERIPVSSYQAFEPYIEQMAQGEQNVLTSDPLIFMNMTSGSTGKKKLIPVTKRSRAMVSKANRVAMGFLFDAVREAQRPLGKILFTSSASSFGTTEGGVAYGPISTSDLRLSNLLYRQVFAYPFEALQISDSVARHYVCLLFALRNPDTRVIGATFPVLAIRLAQHLETYADELIRDLGQGAIAPWLNLDSEIRAALEHQLRPDPRRAQQLQDILEAEGRLTPILAWPDLSLMVTARGGTSNFYFQRFPEYFGDTPVFGGTYASAESNFGVHRGLNTDSVILSIESGFYEFIPEDQWEVPNPKTVLPWDVTVGDRYRIVVTNYSGFYRYDIGDVVEIDGFVGNAPRFVFRHRQGGVLSSSTEKTTEYHATEVMQFLQQEFGVKFENFCITLAKDIVPSPYLVNIEIAGGSTLANPNALLQAFDRRLMNIHQSYAVKRFDGQVPAPWLRILAPGSFACLRQRMIDRGTVESQIKFPLVTENRNWLDDLTVIQEICNESDPLTVVSEARLPVD